MTFLTRSDFQLLKACFAERWHPFLDFLVASGCRFSEATALTPADIDAVNGTVRITRAWKRTPNGYELGQPKTRRSVRTINVPALVLDRLNLTNDWVFVNSDGGPIRLYSWRSMFGCHHWYVIGALLCLAGVAVIMYSLRGH